MKNITLQDAIARLRNRRAADAEENLLYYNDDHLQINNDYRGYIGVLPEVGDADYAFVTEWLARIFAATNLVKSAINRNLDGVLTREPDWNLVFPDGTSETTIEKLTNETDDAIVDWWNDEDVLRRVFREAGRIALLEGESYIRPIVPAGFRNSRGTVAARDLRAAFNLFDFEIVTADQAGIFTDPETGQKFSVCYLESNDVREVEVSWVGADGLTYLKILRESELLAFTESNFPTIAAYFSQLRRDDYDPESEAPPLDLGGRLYLQKVQRDRLITEPGRSLQRSVNYALTTMNKNLNIAGSRDTYATNAQRPQTKVETRDADGNVTSVEYADAPIIKGASNANFIAGIPLRDPQTGKIVDYKQPGIISIDPVAVDTFVKAFEVYQRLFLNEVSQAHILSNDAVAVSGKSRQEARGEFKISLKATKTPLDSAGRYVLDVALKLAAAFCNRTAEFRNVRFDFNCQITVGSVDMEEVRQASLDVTDGKLSLFTYLVLTGVEDPDAEIARMESESDFEMKRLGLALDVANKGVGTLSLLERRRLLFPDKTDTEHAADILQLSKEDPIIAQAYGMDGANDAAETNDARLLNA